MQNSSVAQKPSFTFWHKLILISTITILVATVIRLFIPTQSIPPSDFVTTSVDGVQTSFSDITVSFPATITIPENLPITTVVLEDLTQTTIQNLITTFNLEEHSFLSNFWEGNTHSLSFNQSQQIITLSTIENQIFDPLASQSHGVIDFDIALQDATQLIDRVFPSFNVIYAPESTSFHLFTNHLSEEIPQQEAELARIVYRHNIGEYPIYMGKQNREPFVVLITNKGVQNITLQPIRIIPGDSFSLRTLNEQETLNTILQGNAMVLQVHSDETIDVDYTTLSSGELTLSHIQYRYVEDQRQIVPFYALEGTLLDAQGLRSDVIILTPAVPVR